MLAKVNVVIKGSYFIWNKILKKHQSSFRNADLSMKVLLKNIKNSNQFNQVLGLLHFDSTICSSRLNVHIKEDVQP